ncbi:MAG: hypothetical protein ABF240_06975 [Flavobacteriales bacterium]
MSEISELLKKDVERAVGFKIKSTTEAKDLHQLLTEQANSTISLSTIRRFWGLIPARKPNKNTLNELACFLQYKSFLDYSKQKTENNQWFDTIKINSLKFKSSLTLEDFKLIERHYKGYNSTLFVVNIIENGIHNKNWQVVFDLFNPKRNNLIIENGRISDYTSKVANLTLLFLYQLPSDQFDSAMKELIRDKNFKSYCIYVHVNTMNLNGKYGKILKLIKKTSLDFEEKLFLSLITNLTDYLNSKIINSVPKIDELRLKNLPEVLIGRYSGFQVLSSFLNKDSKKTEMFWDEYTQLFSSYKTNRHLIHEFVFHLMVGRMFSKLDLILTKSHDDIFDYSHIHSYLDGFIFNLIDVAISIKNAEVKRAKTIFANLPINKIMDDSYGDQYLLFYYLIGVHLNHNNTIKQNYLGEYKKLATKSGFQLFDKTYLTEYFN